MSDYDDDEPRGVVARVKHTALLPFHILTSKPAQRAYLTSFLFISTCLFLLVVSITAYVLFYWTYVPRIGFTRPIHLQFDSLDSYPWGAANLASDLVSMQAYDVSVHMRVPRTKTNTEMGNFMLETTLFAPGDKGFMGDADARIPVAMSPDSNRVLASSRRSAILTYYSPIVDLARKATELHWLILGWRLEAETIEIPVFEGVSFAKGWRNIPASMQMQVQSPARMQIYDAKVVFKARFRGLRWIMYNHRIISAVVFIGAFWGTEVLFTAICWGILSFFIFSDSDGPVKHEDEEPRRIKNEESEEEATANLSDTERTFPTYAKAPQLRYQSPAIKKEEEEEQEPFPPLFAATEADDEDEDNDFLLADSGLGTSMESSSSHREESVRKRKSRLSSSNG